MTEIEAELITAATNADAIIESGRDIDGFCAEMMDLCEKAANEIKRLRADVVILNEMGKFKERT